MMRKLLKNSVSFQGVQSMQASIPFVVVVDILWTWTSVAKVQFCVSTPTSGDFEMAVGPMTRISAIRKMLEEVDTDTKYDEYWFSLNGMDNLKESRTFWDLDILSGTMILLSEPLSTILSWVTSQIDLREALLYHFDHPV